MTASRGIMAAIQAKTPEQRFWERVQKTESCWLWRARGTKRGYARFNVQLKPFEKHVILRSA